MPAIQTYYDYGLNFTQRLDRLQLLPSPSPLPRAPRLRRADDPEDPDAEDPETTGGSGTSTDPDKLYDVPEAMAALLEKFNGGTFECEFQLDEGEGYEENGDGKKGTHICGDSATPTYTYWVSNMDVDCDGGDKGGDCSKDPSWQGETRFQDDAGKNINANVVPYVVLNYEDNRIDVDALGIQPLSLVAVVCGGKLTYGVFADSNALYMMGEASLKLAQTCFGSGMSGDAGHGPADVLYVSFVGDAATSVPAGSGSDADALKTMGDALVQAAFGGTVTGGGGGNGNEGGTNSTETATGGGGDEKPTTTKDVETSPTDTGGPVKTTSPVATLLTPTTPAAQPTPTPTLSASPNIFGDNPATTYILIGGGILLVLLIVGFIGFSAFKGHGKNKRRHRDDEDSEEGEDDGDETGTASGSDSDDDDEKGLVHSRHRR